MPPDPARQELLERLRLDQRQRWQKGETVRAEEYLASNATLQTDADGALELIYNEVVLCEETGRRPRLEDFTQRFPQFAERLRPLFEVHQAIEASGDPDPYATVPPAADDGPAPDGTARQLGPTPDKPADDPYVTRIAEGTQGAPTFRQSGVAAPDVIAGYEVLQMLGEGGMGVVFKARHRALQRLVALKMIRPEVYAGTEERSRFLTEAQAIARLQHPHIVQIYEVGEQEGRPFFAMEFVEGGSLDRRLNGTPMPPREAAQLVLLIARAIDAAHQAGIIHRDLKPANILILDPRKLEKPPEAEQAAADLSGHSHVSRIWRRMTRGPQTTLKLKRKPTLHGQQTMISGLGLVPKITDFGLAKSIDRDAGQTRAGTIMGTPSYMPPEQATGDSKAMGPLVDVYAVGAILYETLTGRPPFRGTSVLDTLEQVRKQDPVPPRRLQPNLPRDLETISLKCLEKDPKRRYASAGALGDDLERFLEGEPILARPVGMIERSLKWSRRRKALAALIGVSALATLSLTVLGWWSYVSVSRLAERDRASLLAALKAVDQMLSKAGAEDLADAPQMEPVRKALLEDAQTIYLQFLRERGDDPLVRSEAGRSYSRLGDIRYLLGEHDHAEQAYLHALQLLQRLALEAPASPEFQRELARARHNLGITLKKLNRFDDAEHALREAVRLRDGLATAHAHEPDYRRELASSRYYLGALLAPLAGRRQESEDTYRAALRIQEALATAQPKDSKLLREWARTLNNLAILLKEVKRPETETTFRRALEIQEELVRSDPHKADYKRELARTRGNLGEWYASERRVKLAIEAHESALSLVTELARDFPKVPDYQLDLAVVLTNLAWQLRFTKPREAEDAMMRALAIRNKLVEEFPAVAEYRLRLGQQHNRLGFYFNETGRPLEATRAFDSALEVQRRLVDEYPNVPEYHNALGCTYDSLAALFVSRSEFRERSLPVAAGWASVGANPLGPALVALHARSSLDDACRCLRLGIPELELAVQANRQNAFYCKQLRDSCTLLAEAALRLGNHAEAGLIAEKLAQAPQASADDQTRAVRFLGRCMMLAAQDRQQPGEQRDQVATGYGDRAMTILRKVMSDTSLGREATDRILRGLREHPSYAPLRAREDFRKLMEALTERTGTAVG